MKSSFSDISKIFYKPQKMFLSDIKTPKNEGELLDFINSLQDGSGLIGMDLVFLMISGEFCYHCKNSLKLMHENTSGKEAISLAMENLKSEILKQIKNNCILYGRSASIFRKSDSEMKTLQNIATKNIRIHYAVVDPTDKMLEETDSEILNAIIEQNEIKFVPYFFFLLLNPESPSIEKAKVVYTKRGGFASATEIIELFSNDAMIRTFSNSFLLQLETLLNALLVSMAIE